MEDKNAIYTKQGIYNRILEYRHKIDDALDIIENGIPNIYITREAKGVFCKEVSDTIIQHNGWVAGILSELKRWKDNPC